MHVRASRPFHLDLVLLVPAVVCTPAAAVLTIATVLAETVAISTVRRALAAHVALALLVAAESSESAILAVLSRKSWVSSKCRMLALWWWQASLRCASSTIGSRSRATRLPKSRRRSALRLIEWLEGVL